MVVEKQVHMYIYIYMYVCTHIHIYLSIYLSIYEQVEVEKEDGVLFDERPGDVKSLGDLLQLC